MNLNCLDELVGLATIQKDRVHQLREKERKSNAPLSSLNIAINDYRRLLLSIQKIKFDFGLDEYQGVTPGVRATAGSMTRPDDLQTQQQVLDAINIAEEIFRKHGILSDAPAPDA